MLWRTYDGREWGIGYLWAKQDWIAYLNVLILALGLTYIFTVVSRASYRYRETNDVANRSSQLDQGKLTADLRKSAGTLRSIASAAPYLGLAGTCFGILDSFRGVGMQRAAAVAMITTYIAASLLTTASGVLVALSAIVSYHYLFWLVGKLELRSSPGPLISSRFPLRTRFSRLPAFALIAAPSLALAMAAFMTFSVFRYSRGLEVHLSRMEKMETGNDSSAQPIPVEILESSPASWPEIRVNSKKIDLDDSDSPVWNAFRVNPRRKVYVEAGNNVRWAYVLEVIDIVEAHSGDVVRLTIAPESNSLHTRQVVR